MIHANSGGKYKLALIRLSLLSLQDLDQLFRRHFVCSVVKCHTSRTDLLATSYTLFRIFASHLRMANGAADIVRNVSELAKAAARFDYLRHT